MRRGLSLLELLVVISVSSLMLGLVLTGVQYARAVARRNSCQNNLRQIGLALHQYEASYKCLPMGRGNMGHSPLVSILPQIGQVSLFQQLDLSKDVDGNPIAMITRVKEFRCPDTPDGNPSQTDYVLNRGTTLSDLRDSPWFYEERLRPTFSMFERGLTNTAIYSETSPPTKSGNTRQFGLPERTIKNQYESSIFEKECSDLPGSGPTSTLTNGEFWFGAGTANYYHIFTPNQRSCTNGGLLQSSLFSSLSLHSNGANVLYADARVDFVGSNMDSLAWRAIGAR